MTQFRSPRRRSVRQRSGFGVAEETTGGEVKIKRAKRLDVNSESISLSFSQPDEELPELFDSGDGIVAFAGYVYSPVPIDIEGEVTGRTESGEYSEDDSFAGDPHEWCPIGVHAKISVDMLDEPFGHVESSLKIESEETIPWLDFFGISLSSIEYEDYIDNLLFEDRGDTIRVAFHQKTWMSIPYLYYLDHEEPFLSAPEEFDPANLSDGNHIPLKSCNRCARFLPIEYNRLKERNKISFANHCGPSRAPCNHSQFGHLRIIKDQSDLTNIPESLSDVITHNENGEELDLHHGYQLECKACKKFYVNFPLNPKRNSTQHREDQIRRRTIDALLHELLDKESIYLKYRLNRGKEFDRHIWEEFNKECFKCGEDLESPSEMELDHTRPLAALWPLDEYATCLCSSCNREKSDRFPIEFYSERERSRLSEIIGLSEEELKSKNVCIEAVEELRENIVWFFDDYLAREKLQKDRNGKIVADIVFKSIQNRLTKSDVDLDLINEYQSQMGKLPKTITVE